MQFMVNMPKTQILEYLISLQSLLTINIIGEEIDLTLLEETIKIMDLLWRTNKLKPIHDRIHDKEFLNDSINNNVDLKESMKIWA
jgi:phosphoribosylaminoimidazole carboxylase (NCAIR synthetase)